MAVLLVRDQCTTEKTSVGQMRYWWVNQNRTYHHEVQGGYLWSPIRNTDGARNPFYESMREVAPGDLIFSFMDRLRGIPICNARIVWGQIDRCY